MTPSERQQVELLDCYWSRLEEDDPPPPPGLDPEVAATARQLRSLGRLTAHGGGPHPVSRLFDAAGLAAGAPALPRPAGSSRPPVLPRFAVAAALLLALAASIGLWAARPQPATAEEILRQAIAATQTPPSQIRSLVLTETRDDRMAQGQFHTEARRWYQAPDRWRSEYSAWLGDKPLGEEIVVSDGTRVWDYRLPQNVVRVTPLAEAQGIDGPPSPGALGASEGSSLAEVLQRAGACNTPTLKGSAKILGRDSYVIDTGIGSCLTLEPTRSAPRVELWIDKQTLFLLKAVQYGSDGTPLATMQVTSLQFNVPIEASRFKFTAPPGATVQGPQSSPTPDPTSDRGAAGPAFMGVSGIANTSGVAAEYGLPDQSGLVVTTVLPGGPAARAGIRERDLIRTVDGQEVTSLESLQGVLARHHPGDVITVAVVRADGARDLAVTLGASPAHGQ
jgi:outer membrane lipoprotein-sorting protein